MEHAVERTGGRRRVALPAVLVLSASFASAGSAAEIEVGKPFPVLSLPSLADGKPASLADFRGDKLMLHVWASW